MARPHTTATPTVRDAETTDGAVVLFDMDGVILEGRGTDEVVHERALTDAINERGLGVDAETRSLLAGYEYDTDFVAGCRRLDIDPVEFYDLRERYSAKRAIDRLAVGTRGPYPDVEVLPALAERYSLGLVSNNYDSVVSFVVEHYDLACFSHVSGRDTGLGGFYRRKPDPHHLLAAVSALDGREGLYVGDRATDVLAATRAGLDAVFLRRAHNRDRPTPEGVAIEVGSLEELAAHLGVTTLE